jgi:N-acetyltransferase 10
MDLKRLEAYGNNMIDFHMVRDLIPTVSNLFFSKKLSEELRLSYAQAMIMAGTGLQHKSVDDILGEINMEASQALALFNKSITRIARNLKEIYMKDVESKFDAKFKSNKVNIFFWAANKKIAWRGFKEDGSQ